MGRGELADMNVRKSLGATLIVVGGLAVGVPLLLVGAKLWLSGRGDDSARKRRTKEKRAREARARKARKARRALRALAK